MNRRMFTEIAFSGAVTLANSVGAQTQSSSALIRRVRVFDGERVLPNRSVLIEDGKIARVDSGSVPVTGAELIDGDGLTLLPGLIDAHVHIGEDVKGALAQCLAFGVTTVLDMFNAGARFQTMKSIRSHDPLDMADLRSAGVGATAPGGAPANMGGPPFPTITKPEEAKSFVDARLSEGSDFIKIIYDDVRLLFGSGRSLPKLSRDTLHALVQATHRRNKLVVVHITTEDQAMEVADAGADGLAHMFLGESSSNRFGRIAAKEHMFVIPTLSALYAACGESAGPSLLADSRLEPNIRATWRSSLERTWPGVRPSCSATRQGLRDLIRAKVSVLAGTDAPTPGTTYGCL